MTSVLFHRIKRLLIASLLGCIVAVPSYAQFIDLHLNVDSKLTANTKQPLHFGTLSTNSGKESIDLGSINMGVFSITGLENQLLLVTLKKPDKLYNENSAIKATIPIRLFTRYGYSAQDYHDSYVLPASTSKIKVKPNPEPGPWNTIYIFIYGSINIGNIPNGVYSNDIVLNVEYL